VQIGAVLLCKGGRGGAARGHVGKVTWGHGAYIEDTRAGGHEGKRGKLEAQRLGGPEGTQS
jgi:hypothetical protein